MHTAYLPEITGSEKHIQISNPKEVHHMARVLRLSVGECIGIINGVGGAGKARIVSISAQGPISLELTEFDTRGVLQPKLHLYCAVPKHGRWENILEKGTEIGVTSITPLMTQN